MSGVSVHQPILSLIFNTRCQQINISTVMYTQQPTEYAET